LLPLPDGFIFIHEEETLLEIHIISFAGAVLSLRRQSIAIAGGIPCTGRMIKKFFYRDLSCQRKVFTERIPKSIFVLANDAVTHARPGNRGCS
jgi:hypothetical protein